MTVAGDVYIPWLSVGSSVLVQSKGGRKWPAVVVSKGGGRLLVKIEGDPFPVQVDPKNVLTCTSEPGTVSSQTSTTTTTTRRTRAMPTATASGKSEARELRSQAKALGIAGWEDMTKADLKAAVTAAQAGEDAPAPRKRAARTKAAPEPVAEAVEEAPKPARATRAAKATKTAEKPAAAKPAKAAAKTTKAAAAPKAEKVPVEPGQNPFRKGSDRATMFTLLVKGGVRKSMAEKLQTKVTLRGEAGLNDYDKRLILTAQTLRDEYGYEIQREGRGLDGRLKVVPPTA